MVRKLFSVVVSGGEAFGNCACAGKNIKCCPLIVQPEGRLLQRLLHKRPRSPLRRSPYARGSEQSGALFRARRGCAEPERPPSRGSRVLPGRARRRCPGSRDRGGSGGRPRRAWRGALRARAPTGRRRPHPRGRVVRPPPSERAPARSVAQAAPRALAPTDRGAQSHARRSAAHRARGACVRAAWLVPDRARPQGRARHRGRPRPAGSATARLRARPRSARAAARAGS